MENGKSTTEYRQNKGVYFVCISRRKVFGHVVENLQHGIRRQEL